MNLIEKLQSIGYSSTEQFKNLYTNTAASISYSDGTIENLIFDRLKSLPENKIERERELEEGIVDWPTKYHFTWERVNILKPLDFNGDERVLELGGGTGVLSEYLCDRVRDVVSIEGTLSRAKSIAARCKYKKNIDVIVADFLELDLVGIFGENSFDKITLIGVMEYVPKFAKENETDPIINLLKICNKLIKPDGELIIAIENKIGLKYLLGFEEDHNAKKQYGPQSFYKKNDVTTFSKAELKEKLHQSGFAPPDFYFPFPDYKLPQVIIREGDEIQTLQAKKLLSNLLYSSSSQNYSGRTTPDIHEGRVLGNFIENDALDLISNSFLLIAKKTKDKEFAIQPFAYYYSVNRRFNYANEITFFKENDTIKVLKHWFGKITNDNVLNLAKEGSFAYEFIEGQSVHIALDNHFLLNEKQAYITLFKKWIQFLENNINNSKYQTFDMMPFNTLVDSSGDLLFIDVDEWQPSKNLSVSQVVSRYIISHKKYFEWALSIKKTKALQFMNNVLNYFGLPSLSDDEYTYISELNAFLKNEISRKEYKEKGPESKKQKSILASIKNKMPYPLKQILKRLKS